MSTVVDQPGVPPAGGTRRFSIASVSGPGLSPVILASPGVAAFIAWRVSLLHVSVTHLNDYGLPPALPITWYAALLVAVVGAVTATTAKRSNTLIMLGYLTVVVFILYGTVPVLSAQPHYAWVYKHIGVVRFLEAHGTVDPHIDIYNRWPGFFALGAVFSRIAGHSNPETYAGWAELFFLLVAASAVIVSVRVITRDVRIASCAALFFVLTNWVGQTYYSPQAFAFVLGLALIAILFRQLRVPTANYSRRLTRLVEWVGRVPQLPVEIDDWARWPRWAAIVTVLGIDAIIVASHQLTPYMLLVSIALLMLTGVIRPWWLLFAMAIMTFAYLGANLRFIEHNYGLFTSIDPFNNIYVKRYSGVPTAGKTFNTHVQLLLIAILWLCSLIAAFRLLRKGLLMRALPLVVLALAPFGIILGQNYGGEASLRIILFSSPWTGALIAWGLATVVRPRVKWLFATGVVVTFAALFVPSFLGQEELNIISPGEVQASGWFYTHAPRGSVLVLGAPGFPYRYGAAYADYSGPEGDANPNLMTSKGFQGRDLGEAEIPGVIGRITEYSKHGFVAFTKDEEAYAEALGITPPHALAHLEDAVARSPYFRLWYSNADARIYELVGGPFIQPVTAGSLPLLYLGSKTTGHAQPVPRRTGRRAKLRHSRSRSRSGHASGLPQCRGRLFVHGHQVCQAKHVASQVRTHGTSLKKPVVPTTKR